MAWTVEIEARAERDLGFAYDHYLGAAIALGEDDESAAASARLRMERTLNAASRLANTPYIGTRHDLIADGVRHVTLDGAIFWFRTDSSTETIRIIGIFHGGQDHLGRMLARLTAEGGGAG